MAVSGPPAVVIATNGFGMAVQPVDENAPMLTIADNGFGVPIVISENGAPYIVQGYAALELDFLSGTLDPRITFTRASIATYFNSAGVLTVASTNAPRFDYDPVTLLPKGLMIEGARTNLALRSIEFSNATWVKTGSAVSANSTTSPANVADADTLIENTATTTQHRALQNITFAAGAYSYFVFAKAAGRNFIRLVATDGVTSFAGYFNISTGALGGTVGGATSTIRSVGNGWYQCAISFTSAAGAGSVAVRLADTISNDTYTGDGASGAYLWSAQLEAGAFPSSIMPTTSASATRAADVAVMTGANFSDWFNASEGAFVVEASISATADSKGVFAASDGTATNEFFQYATTAAVNLITNGGAVQANIVIAGVVTANVAFKDALAYKINDISGAANGTLGTADIIATIPTVTALRLGARGDGTFAMFGHIRSLDYYNTRLPNSELQRLTA